MTDAKKEVARAKRPLKRLVIPFNSLPLGTRFKYINRDNDNTYVILSRDGCGLVTMWEDSFCNSFLNQVMSAFDSEKEKNEAKVIVQLIKMWKIKEILLNTSSQKISVDEGSIYFETMFDNLGIDLVFD